MFCHFIYFYLDDIHISNGDLYIYYRCSDFIFDIKAFISTSIIFVKFLFRVYICNLVESVDFCNSSVPSILVNLSS